MDISICSYSFHRLLESGQQDVFRYIRDCRALGCTMLDLWNAHLPPLLAPTSPSTIRTTPDDAQLSKTETDYLNRIKTAADAEGLPFGCLAVDGAHIYEASPEQREARRIMAFRWLNIAARLGARQVRIDSGGPAEMPEDVLEVIAAGYEKLIQRAREIGTEVLMENHWGASQIPENVARILDAVRGLGLLFDTGNWPEGMHEKGLAMCAKYARATHIKTFAFDAQGNETTMDVPGAIRALRHAGYSGCWSIESCPSDGDEYGAARQSIALIRRVLADKSG